MGLLGILLLGCATGADYALSLVPVVPDNQAPFDGLDSLELALEHADGSVEVYPLEGLEGSPSLQEMGALSGTRLSVRGALDGTLVATGRSVPLSLETGSQEVEVLVASTQGMAWLTQPELPIGGSAMAAVDGRFYIFGGELESLDYFNDAEGVGSAQIWSVDIATPGGLTLDALEISLPEHQKGTDTWAGATASALSDGRILVAGGGAWMCADGESTLYEYFLFDPETQTLTAPQELRVSRLMHHAVVLRGDRVLLIGGKSTGGDAARRVEVYDAASDSTELGDNVDSRMPAAVALDEVSALVCGGLNLQDEPTDQCFVVDNLGGVNEVAPLPAPRDAVAMAQLEPGVVLAAGGTDDSGVRSEAWLYDAKSDSWTAVGSLGTARALHRLVPVGDGSALALGGLTDVELGRPAWDDGVAGEAVSCVERFDTASRSFTALRDCGLEDDSVGLPQRAYLPSVATDPIYGTLALGGFGVEDLMSPVSGLSYFPALPEDP